MADKNILIDNRYWIHWQLTPNKWNTLAKVLIEQEKETMISSLFSTFILVFLLAIVGLGFTVSIFLFSIASLIIWFRFQSNCRNYSLAKTTVDIYIGSKESLINALINGKSYSCKKDFLERVSFESYSQNVNSINLVFRSSVYKSRPRFSIYCPVPEGKEEEAEKVLEKFRNICETNKTNLFYYWRN